MEERKDREMKQEDTGIVSMRDLLEELAGGHYKRKNGVDLCIPRESCFHRELSADMTLRELGEVLTEEMRNEENWISTRMNLTLRFGKNAQNEYGITDVDMNPADPVFLDLVETLAEMKPKKRKRLLSFLDDRDYKKLRKGVFSIISY